MEIVALVNLTTVHIHHDHAKEAHTSASQALALASECGYQLLERQARAITS